jgi:hypothetical protein
MNQMPHEAAAAAVGRAADKVMSGEAMDAARDKAGEVGGRVKGALQHAAGGWSGGGGGGASAGAGVRGCGCGRGHHALQRAPPAARPQARRLASARTGNQERSGPGAPRPPRSGPGLPAGPAQAPQGRFGRLPPGCRAHHAADAVSDAAGAARERVSQAGTAAHDAAQDAASAARARASEASGQVTELSDELVPR